MGVVLKRDGWLVPFIVLLVVISDYSRSPGKLRYLCGNCGTQLVAKFPGRDSLVVRVTTLDEDPGQRPERQIWASHEVKWLGYGAEVVAYPEWQPGRK